MKRPRDSSFNNISSKRKNIPKKVTFKEYNLHQDGFVIFRNALEITPFITKKIEDLEKHKSYEFIFNNEQNDLKRSQMELDLDDPLAKEIINMTKLYYKKVATKNHFFKNMVVLKSEEGCKEQIPHTDYVLTEEFLNLKPSELPLAMIVPLQDKSYFNVWPEAINFKKNLNEKPTKFKKKILELSKGDLVFFRGDLVHAGAYFPEKNYRIHCYIDSIYFKRKHDTTFYVKEDGEQKFGEEFANQFIE